MLARNITLHPSDFLEQEGRPPGGMIEPAKLLLLAVATIALVAASLSPWRRRFGRISVPGSMLPTAFERWAWLSLQSRCR